MATLSRELRKVLEKVVLAARDEAEAGARKALDQLAVAHHEPWPTMSSDHQKLRRRLRARGRQLGDRLEGGGQQGVDHLVSECAHEQWHRMLFARFLAECGLLMEPESGVSVSVDECKELARERGADWISLASTFAQGMLPQIFRADDAVLEINLPAEHRQPLEQLLMSLSSEVFLADDSLGWVYQFWQSKEKDRVNKSEKKIGADELAVVTQLFTEDYMVEFLLHNTLGAWWAGRRFPNGIEAIAEDGARAAVSLPDVEWKYLRLVQNDAGRWIPAAGTFNGWPASARELRVLDPCMGSGHFLVFALPILVSMRRTEEGLPANSACACVVGENLFGLEIDARCTQIGAFNLALAAWKLAGWQALPPLNLACSGLGLNARREDWVRLAGSDDGARRGMEQLYGLFAQSRVLGSLVDPNKLGGDLLASGFHALQPQFERALRQEQADEIEHELAVTAQGVTRAAEILVGQFTLVVTNVPYLGRGKQDEALMDYCERVYPEAKADLATCFVERCLAHCAAGGSAALVTPQNWLFLGTYTRLRRRQLEEAQWDMVARLGEHAFDSSQAAGAFVAMIGLTRRAPNEAHAFAGFDASEQLTPETKAGQLRHGGLRLVEQERQISNPDARIAFEFDNTAVLLARFAVASQGIPTSDGPLFVRKFWELPALSDGWEFHQGTVLQTMHHGGREDIILFEEGEGRLRRMSAEQERDRRRDFQGANAWGRAGVAVSLMRELFCTLYTGEKFDNNVAAVVPNDPILVPALWTYCTSSEFTERVRQIDQKLNVTNATLIKVPFDLAHWQRVAAEKYPHGLPKPFSSDPTQWLYNGNPKGGDQPLQAAVARLLGYRWPRQTGSCFPECPSLESDSLESSEDEDGIVCISALKGEEPAAERLSALLAAAYGDEWADPRLSELLAQVGYGGKTLEMWLRNGFFEQHCEVFHQRPFVWHVWDGLKDGFSALVNYHRLSKANLEKLTYAYLGDWIRRQEAAARTGEAGSEARLVAAIGLQNELKKILEGEPPYDIFVRWKPLAEQTIGWEPDLNDGVRMNIRPFLMAADVGKTAAGILRARPNIKWDKDRGKEPSRTKDEFPWFWGWDGKTKDFAGTSSFDGNRWNNLHYSREFKIAARRQKGFA